MLSDCLASEAHRFNRLRPGTLRLRSVRRFRLLPLVVFVGAVGALAPAPDAPASAAPARQGRVVLSGSGLGPVKLGAGQRAATARLVTLLGRPTTYPPPDCVGGYRNVEWRDLIVQFKQGRFAGYRYWYTQLSQGVTSQGVPHEPGTPTLFTGKGVTLGSTFGAVKRAYPHLTQTGTDFWSSGGLTFAVFAAQYPAPSSAPIYEIKVNACPAAL